MVLGSIAHCGTFGKWHLMQSRIKKMHSKYNWLYRPQWSTGTYFIEPEVSILSNSLAILPACCYCIILNLLVHWSAISVFALRWHVHERCYRRTIPQEIIKPWIWSPPTAHCVLEQNTLVNIAPIQWQKWVASVVQRAGVVTFRAAPNHLENLVKHTPVCGLLSHFQVNLTRKMFRRSDWFERPL